MMPVFNKIDTSSVSESVKRLVNSTGNKSTVQASNAELVRLLSIVEELETRQDTSGFHKWFRPGTPYGIDKLPKHKALFSATKDYRELLMLGGNRCGKTRSGATIIAILATGQYPDWWDGIRFDHPVSLWAVGKTGQSTRDTVQEALMGPVGAWGTGALPADCIGDKTARQGIANALDTIQVRHVSGGISTIGFKSYDQKAASFYGTAKHCVWLDEPAPDLVYAECLVRTMTTKGLVVHTITPKEGLTPMLSQFLRNCELLAGTERVKGLDAVDALETDGTQKLITNSRAAIAIGMKDVPWLDDQTILEILSGQPLFLRQAVRDGIPALGTGAIYPIPLEDIVLTQQAAQALRPFPAHWKYLYGMDVGWNRTAVVFLVHDPDTDIIYVTDEYYGQKAEPEIHAARIKQRGEWMLGVIDPAARARSQVDGQQLIRIYKALGLKIREADNSVEAGIYKVWSRLSTGRLKFFPNTSALQNEYMLYQRDESGRIIKENDHALDALRYAINTFHLAAPRLSVMPIPSTGKKYNV